MSGKLCYTCYDDVTFQYHGYVPEAFNREIKRYVDSIYEDLTIKCGLCNRTVIFNRDKETGKWVQNEVTANE